MKSGYIADPTLSTHNVQVAAEDRGADFKYNAKVVHILKQDDRLKYLKREINLKFYSRLREINKESSFSVLG